MTNAAVESKPPESPPMFRILFVDDEPSILTALRRLMRKHPYECFFAEGARQGLEVLASSPIDLIVSDMRMPEIDGAAFLAEVKKRWPFSVRFLMTGYADMNAAINALNKGGINRYINKPWDEDALLEAIEEGLRIRRLEREKKRLIDKSRRQNEELRQLNEELEARVSERTRETREKSDMLKKAIQQIESSYDAFVRVFSTVISSRPQLQKGQSRQVADLAKALAHQLSLDKAQTAHVYYAALLHEIGKLNLPDDILTRAEAHLTYRDRDAYQKYPQMGEMFLSSIPALAPTAKIIRQHMELYDGSGYPDQLKGHGIELGARILRVAHDFVGLQSGLLTTTPYDAERAYRYIEEYTGRRYDPDIVGRLHPLIHDFAIALTQDHEKICQPSELQPGMVLTRDLVNRCGILLMVAGASLNEQMINRLRELEQIDSRRVTVYVAKPKHEE
ncbi:HD domain-containing phosphohydrolase [Marinobacter sp. SS21]|uniref:HD domain-containing phosphohydrolase n=1 Tax=Marinobacter sp. SS21 TaxID=2979460 RepID=UPI00232C2135|nr:HD domain-containing phosphohydrolase [Marinobacter sp. SS21]MDC0663770.1 response regulator [Marinobacter sp. SS21]